MSELTPEKRARQEIDDQLTTAGWFVQNYKAVDFSVGRGIALREVPLKTGPCDYLLLVDRIAVGVIEAAAWASSHADHLSAATHAQCARRPRTS